jgi:hypothetical protein
VLPGPDQPGQTLVVTASGGGDGRQQPSTLGIAVAQGEVGPCMPVKAAQVPPPEPPGKAGAGQAATASH